MKYNKLIDHTLLKQDATPEQIVKLCEEAKAFDFMSVCVNPAYVPLASECLKGSDVKVYRYSGFGFLAEFLGLRRYFNDRFFF